MEHGEFYNNRLGPAEERHTCNPHPDLLPCPFCGGEPTKQGLRDGEARVIFLTCLECRKKDRHVNVYGGSIEAAIESWNRRPALTADTLTPTL